MSEELKKVTLNLYKDDVRAMELRYGYGWSEKVRQLVHDHLRGFKAKMTVPKYEDLAKLLEKHK